MKDENLKAKKETGNFTLKNYVIGFLLSIILTLTAYFITAVHLQTNHNFPPDQIAMYILAGLGITQFIVQLIFFLHLGRGSKSRWNLIVFLFAFTVIVILVAGSLWIMQNLNYNMTPKDIYQYMIKMDAIP